MINIKSKKGITLVALISTVIVLLILAGVTINSINTSNTVGAYNKMIADIRLLSDKVNIYYNKYGEIPKTNRWATIDDVEYYEIDLGKLDNITLNYGQDYSNGKRLTTVSDVYLINSNLDIYYLKGIDKDDAIYHNETNTNQSETAFGRLPKEYTEIEYLESTGSQWIDTGIYVKNSMTIKSKFKILSGASYYYLFGANNNSRTGYPGVFMCLRDSGQSNYLTWRYGNTTIEKTQTVLPFDTMHNLELSYRKLVLNGITFNAKNSENWSNMNYPMYIFTANLQGNNYSRFTKIKLYEFEVYNESGIYRNYIPAKRKSDSKPGLYDKVTGTFYTNQGTGDDFTAGPEV